MKPAKEWLLDAHKIDASLAEVFSVTVAEVLARDIEVLEEAAKADCEYCGKYGSVPNPHGRTWYHKEHEAYCLVPGTRWLIHDRVAELKKKQDSESGGGCPTPRKRETVTMAHRHPAAVRPAVTDEDRIQAMFDALWRVSNSPVISDWMVRQKNAPDTAQAVDDALDGWKYRNE